MKVVRLEGRKRKVKESEVDINRSYIYTITSINNTLHNHNSTINSATDCYRSPPLHIHAGIATELRKLPSLSCLISFVSG